MIAELRFDSLDAFYARRGGRHSGEADYGVFWHRGYTTYPNFRVSVVHDTGDVYALNLTTNAVEVLGTLDHVNLCANLRNGAHDAELCAYPIAERLFEGWTDHIHESNSLAWIRARLAAAVPV
jgi:hypothetical protein